MTLEQRGPMMLTGDTADRPAAGKAGRFFFDTEAGAISFDNGTTWDDIANLSAGGAATATLTWGARLAAGTATERTMRANGHATDGDAAVGSDVGNHVCPFAGTLDFLSVLCQEAGTDTFDQIKIYINGSLVFDSGTGLALNNDESFETVPGDVIAAGDVIQVTMKKAGTNASMDVQATVVIGAS